MQGVIKIYLKADIFSLILRPLWHGGQRGHFILVFDVMRRGGVDGGDYFVVSVYTCTVGECQVS